VNPSAGGRTHRAGLLDTSATPLNPTGMVGYSTKDVGGGPSSNNEQIPTLNSFIMRNAKSRSIRESTIKISAVLRRPDHYQPWDLRYQENSGGSGCILSNGRILTAAHVVADAIYVQVHKPGDVASYHAEVEVIDHDSELALLVVKESDFLCGTSPVQFGEIPEPEQTVIAYGFPEGGNDVSATSGVISRVEVQLYAYSKRRLLAIQTDASLNPGNSGGPVMSDDRCVGIAFQTKAVIPVPVITRFLEDASDGHISGVPDLGIYWQRIENDAFRQWARIPRSKGGVLVSRVVCGGSADGILQEDDVLLSIDRVEIQRDGSVVVGRLQAEFTHLISQRQVGESVELSVLRAGEPMSLTVELRRLVTLVPSRPGRVPSYFILGGLVFVPLTHQYLTSWDWQHVNPRFRHYYENGLPSRERHEVVIVNQVLAHDVNVGYHDIRQAVVERMNGVAIRCLPDIVAAANTPVGGFHVIEIDDHGLPGHDLVNACGTRIVLDAELVERFTAEILQIHNIVRDRSGDL
jgi:S1-C subfamily serine protease